MYAYNDEGATRAARFWCCVLPIYGHYQWTEYQTKGMAEAESAKRFDELHDRYAPQAERLVLDMRGFFIKIAQLASTRDDFVPPQYMRFFKTVQDKVPPAVGEGEVVGVVEASLGMKVDDVFDSLELTPFASATIGQVHKARLKDGREVAVKLQYPNAEAKFRADIGLVLAFCSLAMPQHVAPLTEFRNQFESEFDYVTEAKLTKEISDNITPVFGTQVRLPNPVMPLCRKTILVMELLKGRKLDTAITDQYTAIAHSKGQTLEQLQRENKDMSPAHYRRMIKLSEINATISRCIDRVIWAYNHTLGNVLPTLSYTNYSALIDVPAILDLLLEVHGHQVFVDGVFNADPHPGNIMLLDDGRLGLVDYGQVGRLSVQHRLVFAKLMIALANRDKEGVVDLLTNEMKYRFKYQKPTVMYRYISFYLDRDTRDVTDGMNPMQFMGWLDAEDPLVYIDPYWVLCGRLSLVLRGFGNAFNIPLSMAERWRGLAEAALVRAG